jgi:hypothetical protein
MQELGQQQRRLRQQPDLKKVLVTPVLRGLKHRSTQAQQRPAPLVVKELFLL